MQAAAINGRPGVEALRACVRAAQRVKGHGHSVDVRGRRVMRCEV